MRPVDLIVRKRDGHALSREEIERFVAGVTDGSWPDYQTAALLMAIVVRGMTGEETAHLTDAMVRSGVRFDLSGLGAPAVGKHSTGGVGDKTSLVVAPLAAACGALVPMISGRALGHSGGTLDKLEAIPGFRTLLSPDEFRRQLEQVGCVIAGQTAEMVPADRRLYALRDVTGTVPSVPLITASIMSKKIAEGIGALVLDVKVGGGAFMKTADNARQLARSLVDTGELAGVRTEALITAMDAPLGRAVGNALEVAEAVETLQGRGPSDLEHLAVVLASRMLRLAGLASSDEESEARAGRALASGAALEKFRQMVAHQGGDVRIVDDPSRLPAAPRRDVVLAPRAGVVVEMDAERIGQATMLLGAGRSSVADRIDPAVGTIVVGRLGQPVAAGELLVELRYSDPARLEAARALIERAITIDDLGRPVAPLVRERVAAARTSEDP